MAGGARRSPGRRVVLTGAALGLAVSLPAALAAQVADALVDGDPPAALSFALVAVVLVGVGVGGWTVGDRRTRGGASAGSAVALGAVSGLAAITVVEAVGVARRLVADEAVAWSTVPAVLATAAGVAAVAAWRASRRAAARQGGRTRP